jgi:hypothetical protein
MSEISVTQKLLLALEDQRYIVLPSFVSDAIIEQDIALQFIQPTAQSFSPYISILEALIGDGNAIQVLCGTKNESNFRKYCRHPITNHIF